MTVRGAEQVLSEIAGFEGAAIVAMTGGLTNTTYRVAKGDRVAVLKIDQAPRGEPFNSRQAEAKIQRSAAAVGLAASVIAVGDCYYLSEFVEGEVWNRDQLQNGASLEQLGNTLRKLHSLPLAGHSFDATAAAREYAAQAANLEASIISLCLDLIAGIRMPHNLCCCHNDLVAENIVATPQLMFLDWEYACDNDPFFDLATLIEQHDLNESQTSRLLNAYFDGDGERWMQNLDTYRGLYLALLCLWTASRPSHDALELDRIVRRITTRYS